MLVFPKASSGPVAPTRVIAGPATGLSTPLGLTVFRGEIYVPDGNSIRVFPINASGDAAPARVITGPHTSLALPTVALVF